MSEIDAYNADALLLKAKLVEAGPEFDWYVNDYATEIYIAEQEGVPFMGELRVSGKTKQRYDRGRIFNETFVFREALSYRDSNFADVVVGWAREGVEYLLNNEDADFSLSP